MQDHNTVNRVQGGHKQSYRSSVFRNHLCLLKKLQSKQDDAKKTWTHRQILDMTADEGTELNREKYGRLNSMRRSTKRFSISCELASNGTNRRKEKEMAYVKKEDRNPLRDLRHRLVSDSPEEVQRYAEEIQEHLRSDVTDHLEATRAAKAPEKKDGLEVSASRSRVPTKKPVSQRKK